MPTRYRVIDLSSMVIDADELIVQSTSPERAVREALGVEVVRSGARGDLRARVYFSTRVNQSPGSPLFEGRPAADLSAGHISLLLQSVGVPSCGHAGHGSVPH
jgi:hypothetical protein